MVTFDRTTFFYFHKLKRSNWCFLPCKKIFYVISARKIKRQPEEKIELLLQEFPGITCLDPSQVGKPTLTPSLSKGFHLESEDIKAKKQFIVYPGNEKFSLTRNVEVIPVTEMMAEMQRI